MDDAGDTGRADDQYSPESLTRYEWIFGQAFLSSGAPETAHYAAKSLGLCAGSRVLDIGCGLGGTAFLFSESYAAIVTGLDVLPQMVAEAHDRARKKQTQDVAFLLGDVLTSPLPAESFDAAYSKDSFLHILDKRKLVEKLYQALAPGGRVFFTDYLRGAKHGGEEFESYVAKSGYWLTTRSHYTALLQEVGFVEVSSEDWTHRLIRILRADIEKMRSPGSTSHGPTSSDIDYLVDRWELKLRCLHSGDMKWGSFAAQRPPLPRK